MRDCCAPSANHFWYPVRAHVVVESSHLQCPSMPRVEQREQHKTLEVREPNLIVPSPMTGSRALEKKKKTTKGFRARADALVWALSATPSPAHRCGQRLPCPSAAFESPGHRWCNSTISPDTAARASPANKFVCRFERDTCHFST